MPEGARLAPPPRVEAHDAYLRGRALAVQDTPEGYREAIPHFLEAVELDPDYGQAHAALASVYYILSTRAWFRILDWTLVEARRAAYESLERAMGQPTALAHAVASSMALNNGRHQEAIDEARRAIDLDPNDPSGHIRLSEALTMDGHPADAIPYAEQAMRLDPYHPPSYLWVLGLAYFGLERYPVAAIHFESAARRSEELLFAPLAATYAYLGRHEEAQAMLERLRAQERERFPGFPFNLRGQMGYYSYRDPADTQRLADGLRLAGLE